MVQLRQWLRRFLLRVEPEAARKRREDAHAERSVRISHLDDAMALLQATIPATDALLLERELTIAAKHARRDDDGNDDGRTLDQARADVLVDRLLGRDAEQAGRGRFHIGITVGVHTILGLSDEPGSSADERLPLDPALVRELCMQPGTLFTRLVTDEAGGVLNATELGRFPSATLKRQLELLDGVCAYPTCNAPAMSADKDHVTPYDAEHPGRGPTCSGNLWCLCRRHHRLKTLGLLRAEVFLDEHRWTLPSGTTAPSRTHQRRAWLKLPVEPLVVEIYRPMPQIECVAV